MNTRQLLVWKVYTWGTATTWRGPFYNGQGREQSTEQLACGKGTMVHLPEWGKRQEQGCESDMMGKYTRCGSFQGWQLSWWWLVGKCDISRRVRKGWFKRVQKVGYWVMVDFGGLLLCWPCVLCSSKSGKIEYLLIQWELSHALRGWTRVNWASESESGLIMRVCWVLWAWWLKNRVTTPLA